MPPILDVAIGLLFVYLLFSLIVTAARELCVAFTKSSWDKRAELLQEGIGEMFGDKNAANGFSREFYKHPLISALSPKGNKALPNYIPRETFVSTILNLIADPKATGPRTADQVLAGIFGSIRPIFIDRATKALRDLRAKYANDAAINPLITECLGLVDSAASTAADRTSFSNAFTRIKNAVDQALNTEKGDRDTKKTAADAAKNDATKQQQWQDAEAEYQKINAYAQALAGIETLVPLLDDGVATAAAQVSGELRRTLLALFDDAGHDIEEFKKQLGAWFDRSMDRVTGWYKKYAQGFTLLLGFVLAFACNVDSLRIVDALSSDEKLRGEIVSKATEYAGRSQGSGAKAREAEARAEKAKQDADTETDATKKANALKAAEELAKDAKSARDAWQAEVAKAATKVADAEKAEKEATRKKTDTDANEKATAEEKKNAGKAAADRIEELKSARETLERIKAGGSSNEVVRLKEAVREMNGFGLPIGWHEGELKTWWLDLWQAPPSATSIRAILGWLLTALAASLGAPFWFDTLNKIVTIRAGGRAPEEKDPGENGGSNNKKNGAEKKP